MSNIDSPLPPEATSQAPRGDLQGLRRHWQKDLLSGFLVFLIALPLCLGISLASGYPAIAGVFTAIIGSIVTSLISNSELTIKGPAAGLIVIALGTVLEFGFTGGKDPAADFQAYRLALGVGVAAGVLQIIFALFRSGIIGEFFPTTVVHGMLAAIGVIIMSKQLHVLLGVKPEASEPLALIAELPKSVMNMNPEIAAIGIMSVCILFGLSLIRNKYVKRIPGPLIVLLLAVPLGMSFDLDHEHVYSLGGRVFNLGPKFLVDVPSNMFNVLTFPDFSGLQTLNGWKWVLMFALIGSLESLLSAKAIDAIDPWQRKTNFDRDMLAVGVGNTLAALVGGLPMISEIVRSKANIDNGARTRFADMFHGLFLLAFVALAPGLVHEIPLAALAAMLVFTGFRLASPREFINVFKIGREQLIIFVTTVVAVLATDLLIGIGIGIVLKFLIHRMNGAPLRAFFMPPMTVEFWGENTGTVIVQDSAVFSNWISLKREIDKLNGLRLVIVDLSETRLVDHTVMEKLHEMQHAFEESHRVLVVSGLNEHEALSSHPNAARKRKSVLST